MSSSSTFYPLGRSVAQNYQTNCPGATIIITQSSSASAWFDVEAGGVQIAASDLPASAGQVDLVDHLASVVVFAVVINSDVGFVTNLTTQQLQAIYSGSIRNWRQLGGPNLPITVVSETSTSGIRATFEKYVLGGPEMLPLGPEYKVVNRTDEVAKTVQTTAGAIGYVDLATATQSGLRIVSIDQTAPISGLVKQNYYKFWAIVHMYTKGLPPLIPLLAPSSNICMEVTQTQLLPLSHISTSMRCRIMR